MNYNLTYDDQLNIIKGHFDGVITQESLQAAFIVFMNFMQEKKCNRILNDIRDAIFDLSTLDLYYLPKYLSKIEYPHLSKRAIVVNAIDDSLRFWETVLVNSSWSVKIFTDPEEAIEWLTRDR
jgi:hypothetical protein